jgi:hypothetical protein
MMMHKSRGTTSGPPGEPDDGPTAA